MNHLLSADIISESKKSARALARKALSEFSQSNDISALSLKICDAVIHSQAYGDCEELLAYIPTATEADCLPLIKRAVADGKRTAVPRVDARTSSMDFFFLKSTLPIEKQLEVGSFGLKEPLRSLEKLLIKSENACAQSCGASSKRLIIVPGLAFSRGGKRLGRGKGFYDRFLAKLKSLSPASDSAANQQKNANCAAAGFCFSAQLSDCIPTDRFDAEVDIIFTETETIII